MPAGKTENWQKITLKKFLVTNHSKFWEEGHVSVMGAGDREDLQEEVPLELR